MPELALIEQRLRRCPPLGGVGRRGGPRRRSNAARIASTARAFYRVQQHLHRIGQLTPEVIRRGAPVPAKRFRERQQLRSAGCLQLALPL